MVRKILFACGGMLLFTLVFQWGAHSAGAQAPAPTAYGVDMGNRAVMAAIGRTIVWMSDSGIPTSLPPVPGTSPIVAIGGQGLSSNGVVVALLENGDAYQKDSGAFAWQRYPSNLYNLATGGARVSMGELKARYR